MVEFINSFTGTLMQVADERKDEYLAAGHKLVAKTSPVAIEPVKEEKPVKKTVKKSAKK